MPQAYYEYLKCDLTNSEIANTARELARANARRQAVEQQKKEVDSQLKSEIEAANTVISRLSTLINTGHEYRDIECRVELDTPEAGKKRIIRLDTGEEVNIKPMTDADRQMVMDLQTAAEAEEAKQEPPKESIVTPPPVLKTIGGGVSFITASGEIKPIEEVSSAAEVAAEGEAPLAAAHLVGGTHQRKRKGKEAAAGDQQ